MRIDILSLFPAMFDGPFGDSIIKRAVEKGILDINITNPRDFAQGKHQQVDDTPFGGGSGMVMKPEPVFRAVKHVKLHTQYENRRVLLLSPEGQVFTQSKARELAQLDQLILICGHYEGFDARISENLADEIISIGDYVLTGGELPAMIITDAVARMLPGVLGSEESAPTDSFYNGLLEHPQYTRPRDFEGLTVPEVLLSGDHARIAKWRRQKSLEITLRNRPDLLEVAELADEDRKYIELLKQGITTDK
ncbi:tRNA (guanosine(37)-N1)-methyltransferase TrmD [Anaerovibrio sp.]|uniref:tRNA (guanosine(37)-N1)-methyltransferase TrmD n=1 Tax=Anaerovibrio sp. TaxID=1872532 RepID=UPI0025C3E120|nr:tRNA (guanosine(37)-N1)-methyltransferase TrmD [Anaerovibrio sp.]MBR2143755.1 tRNA (guanosine(37)-N1)-methyltransferase TrmD [Anaerovibrio sp.]